MKVWRMQAISTNVHIFILILKCRGCSFTMIYYKNVPLEFSLMSSKLLTSFCVPWGYLPVIASECYILHIIIKINYM